MQRIYGTALNSIFTEFFLLFCFTHVQAHTFGICHIQFETIYRTQQHRPTLSQLFSRTHIRLQLLIYQEQNSYIAICIVLGRARSIALKLVYGTFVWVRSLIFS